MFVVHGRTRCQFYKGDADWSAVRSVVEAVEAPVFVNGDIYDGQDALQAIEQSGANGVMVGRGYCDQAELPKADPLRVRICQSQDPEDVVEALEQAFLQMEVAA